MSDGRSGKEKLPIKEITGQNGRRQDSVILNEVPREDAGFGRLPREPEHLKTRRQEQGSWPHPHHADPAHCPSCVGVVQVQPIRFPVFELAGMEGSCCFSSQLSGSLWKSWAARAKFPRRSATFRTPLRCCRFPHVKSLLVI